MQEIERLHKPHLDRLQKAYTDILNEAQYDGIVIYSGHPTLHFADDQPRTFKSYAHFLHWVPLPGVAHSWLLIRPGQIPILWFHTPIDYWHLPTKLPEAAWVQHFDIILINDHQVPDMPAGHYAIMGDISVEDADKLKGTLNPHTLQAALDEQRMFKSDYEIACLRHANEWAAKGHHAARDAFMAGEAELDIHLAYLKASRQGENDTPYPGIIACNAHAGVLHYQYHDAIPSENFYSLLVDAGCSFAGYSADITRTWCGPSAHPIYCQLVQGIADYQRCLVEKAQAGVDFITLHHRMHELLAALLVELGLVKQMTVEACVTSGITRALCPHGLGHSLGLQTHDVAGFQQDAAGTTKAPPVDDPALRLTRRLLPGMVITIEPGCYFIDSLLVPLHDRNSRHVDWPLIDELKKHGGIRIEDNLVIMPQGNENLTRTYDSGL